MRVVLVGQPFRGDDGVGARVAELLAGAQGPELELHLLADPTELLHVLDPAVRTLVVDAVCTGTAAPGTLHRWDGDDLPSPDPQPASGHALGLATTLALARALGRLPRALTVLGIEGRDFRLGRPLSPEVEEAARAVAAWVTGKATVDSAPP